MRYAVRVRDWFTFALTLERLAHDRVGNRVAVDGEGKVRAIPPFIETEDTATPLGSAPRGATIASVLPDSVESVAVGIGMMVIGTANVTTGSATTRAVMVNVPGAPLATMSGILPKQAPPVFTTMRCGVPRTRPART
jgi:hypothetical protein